jgi:glutamate synthase domain-containing protein 3
MPTINAKGKELKTISKAIKESLDDHPVEVKNAEHLHGLAAGLDRGEVIITGNAGDYLGVLNKGADIKVMGDVGNYAADNMTDGKVTIKGNAGFGAGQYCYGGTVIVHGNAGDFTATMNKGATIIVGHDVGAEVGTYMLAGDLIIIGNAGKNLANYLIQGNVYIGGEWKSLGNNTREETMTDEDTTKLRTLLKEYNFKANPSKFKKIVAASEKPFYH